jgi:hypothetical protein
MPTDSYLTRARKTDPQKDAAMNNHDNHNGTASASPTSSDLELHAVRDALRGLRFGTVTIIVQDGVIVQIDRTEKRRIRRVNNKSESAE